jgi:hypothetical protein
MASSTILRRIAGTLSSLLVAAFVVTGFSGTAHAADGFKYWNYFHLDNDAWAFSQVGSSDYRPADGTVEGYRFGTTTSSDKDGLPPRADLSEVNFDTICGAEEAAAGQKRVGVVIDYGTEADADGTTPPAPRADCAVVPAKANGLQVLQAVADVRIENSFSCAIDGYPVKGCGDPVADAQDTTGEQPVAFELPASEEDTGAANDENAAADDEGSDLLFPLALAGVVVVALAAGAFALNRRNPNA